MVQPRRHRDLAVCIQRAQWLREGRAPTEALARLTESLGIAARVLPPTDAQLRTMVTARGERTGVQDSSSAAGGVGPIDDVTVRGLEEATMTPRPAPRSSWPM